MSRSLALVIAAAVLLVAGPVGASTLYGNPDVKVVLDSGSAVQIGSVRVYACPGQETDALNSTLTTTTSLTASFSEGTWCAMDVQVKWSGAESFEVVPVDGFTTLVTDSAEDQLTIVLDPVSETATLE